MSLLLTIAGKSGRPNTTAAAPNPDPVEPTGDTAADGKQAFLIVGDSLAVGSSITGKGPTPEPGTVYEFNGANVVQVGANDLSNANTGSQYPQMGIQYFNATGKKMTFINTAVGGAEFYPNGDTINWHTSGTLYAAMQTKVTNGLAALGLSKLKGIIKILGINDARGGQDLGQIQTAVNSLYSRLTTQFPGVPIYVVNIGRSENDISNNRIDDVRSFISAAVAANSEVCKMAFDLRTYALNFPQYYSGDNLHLNQTGCNALGTELANFVISNP